MSHQICNFASGHPLDMVLVSNPRFLSMGNHLASWFISLSPNPACYKRPTTVTCVKTFNTQLEGARISRCPGGVTVDSRVTAATVSWAGVPGSHVQGLVCCRCGRVIPSRCPPGHTSIPDTGFGPGDSERLAERRRNLVRCFCAHDAFQLSLYYM